MKKELNLNDKNLLMIIGVLTAISAVIFFAALILGNFGQLNSVVEDGDFATSKYASSLKRAEKLISSYQTDIFSSPAFIQLKSFIKLPLEIGLVGKENPFALPLPPEEQLLEQFLNKN